MLKRLYNLVMKWLQSDITYKELLDNKTLKIDEAIIREVVNEFTDKSFFGSRGILGINPRDIDEFKTCFKVNSDLLRPEFEQTSPWEKATYNSTKEALNRVKKAIFDEIKLRKIKQMPTEDKKAQDIHDIRLSENAIKILEKADKEHVSDLTSMKTDDIRILEKIGFEEEKEIIDKIHSLGLSFRNEPINNKEEQIHKEIEKCIIAKYNVEQEIEMLKMNLLNNERKEKRFLELNEMARAIQKQIDILSLELCLEEKQSENKKTK